MARLQRRALMAPSTFGTKIRVRRALSAFLMSHTPGCSIASLCVVRARVGSGSRRSERRISLSPLGLSTATAQSSPMQSHMIGQKAPSITIRARTICCYTLYLRARSSHATRQERVLALDHAPHAEPLETGREAKRRESHYSKPYKHTSGNLGGRPKSKKWTWLNV